MKNSFNPEVANVEFEIAIELEILIAMGWEFDVEDATGLVGIINIQGTPEEYKTTVCIENEKVYYNGICNGTYEATGDDEKTVEDIITFLEKYYSTGYPEPNRRGFYDSSTNSNYDSVTTFRIKTNAKITVDMESKELTTVGLSKDGTINFYQTGITDDMDFDDICDHLRDREEYYYLTIEKA